MSGAPITRSWAVGVQEGTEPAQRPGVDDLVGGAPAALGDADPVAQVVQLDDRVGVGVDGEPHAVPAGAQAVAWFVADVIAGRRPGQLLPPGFRRPGADDGLAERLARYAATR
jgi:hypothetical protein